MEQDLKQTLIEICQQNENGADQATIEQHLRDRGVKAPKTALTNALNTLLQTQQLQMYTLGDKLTFKTPSEVEKGKQARLRGLNSTDLLVYQIIQTAGNTGVWTRDLRDQSNVPQSYLQKVLNQLEKRGLIKGIKSIQAGSRKMYMLADLTPAKEITGGAWYNQERELDGDYIELLRKAAFQITSNSGAATGKQIVDAIQTKGLLKAGLTNDDILDVIHTLCYDGQLEAIEGEDGQDNFVIAMSSIPQSNALTQVPCGVCPVVARCHPGGEVSPEACQYMDTWLDF